jgi:hypothetical protein
VTADDVKTPRVKTLGLLTFDLDDTIYPLDPVIREANAAFARAMARYGFPDIEPDDINTRSVQIRNEIAKTDPQRAAVLSHTEIRKLAIRKEMELVMLDRKLKECAIDWATNVESLGPAVVGSARKYVILVCLLKQSSILNVFQSLTSVGLLSLLILWAPIFNV